MNQKNTRYLEKKILESTDRLIESAIAASLLGDEAKEREFRRGAELIGDIARNLKELIDVKDDYLPEILNQIISQKLPDTQVQKSLGTFTSELERIVQLGVLGLKSAVVAADGDDPGPGTDGSKENTLDNGVEQREEETSPVDVSDSWETSPQGEAIKEVVDELLKEAGEEDLPGLQSNSEYQACEEPLTGPCLIEDNEQPFNAAEAIPPEEIQVVTTLAPVGSSQQGDAGGKPVEEQIQEELILDGILLRDVLNSQKPTGPHSITPVNNPVSEHSEADAKDQERQPEGFMAQAAKSRPVGPVAKQSLERNLAFSLQLIFPGVELLHNVTIDGVVFNYYLPAKRLAVDQVTLPEDWELKTKICQQEEIAYLIIAAEDGKNPRRVERILQRNKINTRA